MEKNKQAKKVAVILPELYVGGAEKLSISLINDFVNNEVECHFVSIVYTTTSYSLLDELDPAVKVKIIERKRKYDFSVGTQVIDYLKEHGIKDVMVIDLFVYFLICLPLRGKSKTEMPNLFLILHFTKPRSPKEFLLNFIYFRFLNNSTKVLYIFKGQKNFFKKTYWLNALSEKVIYNGINIDYFSREHFDNGTCNRLKAELDIPCTHKIIILVGRISIEKGHSYAIQALKLLHDSYRKKDIHLLFLGSGDEDYLNSLKSLTNSLRLHDFIHFVGNKKDVRPYYLVSDLFTLTSLTEAFSVAALEAMSFGLPCSLTEVGGASEMIVPGLNGLLSKPKDITSIAETWNSILDSEYCADTIRHHVITHFSSKKMFENYYSVVLNEQLPCLSY